MTKLIDCHFLTVFSNELTVVPNSQRNQKSESWHASILRLDNAGLLRRWNLVLFSIMWKAGMHFRISKDVQFLKIRNEKFLPVDADSEKTVFIITVGAS